MQWRDILRREMSIASSVPSARDMVVMLSRTGIETTRAEVVLACARLALPLADVP
jgi:hypothetical protein